MFDWSRTRRGKPIDRVAHALLLMLSCAVIGGLSVNMVVNHTSWLFWPSVAIAIGHALGAYINFRRLTAPESATKPA